MQQIVISILKATNVLRFALVIAVQRPLFIRISAFSSMGSPLSNKVFLSNIHPQYFPVISAPFGNLRK
ncbi:hypothetical protein AQPE_0036 [Aquipluma nitroreducens]|uniref:Uncharacterized protein n=1 Tax=Aquipluma nitroreducens TaxID=2010828 RepID=A0A5K7S355_9BACT|nr:hypothetical protein AQPE_0036 [Aquipluma nitroreducens]